jgi:hypothetical protein
MSISPGRRAGTPRLFSIARKGRALIALSATVATD